jgi:hypothetical protein
MSATATTIPLTAATANSDYQNLLTAIKNTIDKNDRLFQQIQQANYPNAGNYTSDLLNYKIDTKVNDLTQTRQTVWDFVNKKYQENTKLRSFYFDEIRKADGHIADLNTQAQELIDSIQKKQLQTTTANESVKQQKYMFDKKQYYLFLYKILLIVQSAILILLTLCLTGILPRATCLIIIVIILLATLAFVGSYVFYVNIGRSSFNWAKFEHSNDIQSKGGQCADSSGLTPADKQRAAADLAVQAIIDKNVATKCTTPST